MDTSPGQLPCFWLEDTDSEACSVCAATPLRSYEQHEIIIDVPGKNLRDEHSFLKSMVEQSIAEGILFHAPGREQQVFWKRGTRWSDYRWSTIKNDAGPRADRFEIFVLPGMCQIFWEHGAGYSPS